VPQLLGVQQSPLCHCSLLLLVRTVQHCNHFFIADSPILGHFISICFICWFVVFSFMSAFTTWTISSLVRLPSANFTSLEFNCYLLMVPPRSYSAVIRGTAHLLLVGWTESTETTVPA
jgi:hypothetical protein